MNTNQSLLKLRRRDFLKIIGAVGVTAAGGYVLSEYTPWLNYDGQMENTWMAPEQKSNPSKQMRTLVHYPTLAANGHNTSRGNSHSKKMRSKSTQIIPGTYRLWTPITAKCGSAWAAHWRI